MNWFSISLKQKIWFFLVILCVGFIGLAVFTATSLNQMTHQYKLSGDVYKGSADIKQTEISLLKLGSELPSMGRDKISQVKADLNHIQKRAEKNHVYLTDVVSPRSATALKSAINGYHESLVPWLELKAELGFNADDGKLAKLKDIANVIEQKIAETGMVTLNSDFQAMVKAQQNYLLSPNEKNLKLFNRAKFGFANMSNTYAMLDLYEKELESFAKTFEQVAVLSGQLGDIESQMYSSQGEVLAVVSQISEQLATINLSYQDSAASSAQITQWSVLVACGVLALVAIIIFVTLALSLTKALSETNRALESMSTGNLAERLAVTGNTNNEFNRLAIAFNQTCENLGELVREVQSNSDALSENAQDLNVGIDNVVLSQSEVVGQTQVLASATEEISVTTNEVSGSLEHVAQMSKSSTQTAAEGGKVVTLAIESIEEVSTILANAKGHINQLETASGKIDSVMAIINDIAEQTNLLALNAAIEAARAGDQGRGFAVVADEVRSLAVRTVDAVADISGTIDTLKKESAEVIQTIGKSEKSMNIGRERGNDAVKALIDITEKAEEASSQTDVILGSIRELATTSQSMADSMAQISTSMGTIEGSNQQLKQISQVVDQHSTMLNQKCQNFSL